MKKIAFLFCLYVAPSFGAAPITSCPLGYIAIEEPFMTIATSCPAGYISAGTADSCLVSGPSGVCIMYAPVGMSFTESAGHTYEFDDVCPLD